MSDAALRRRGVAALVASVGAGAAAWLLSITPVQEGVILRGYLDDLGIPTKCMGDTRDVVVGQKYSMAECQESMAGALLRHARSVLACAPELKSAPPSVLAAGISWDYNTGALCNPRKAALREQAARRDWPAFCSALLYGRDGRVYYVTGVDATGQRVFLPGLLKRRYVEYAICVTDLPERERPSTHMINARARADLDRITRMAQAELASLQTFDVFEVAKQ